MTREQIVAILNVMQRAWNARDPVGLAAVHADDCVVHSPMFGEVVGRPAIERSYRDLFTAFEDWTFEPLELIVDGARAAQLFSSTATHTSDIFGMPATNRRFKVEGVLLFDFRDGKVALERRLYDFTGLLVQVGILKTKPGR